MVSSDEKSIPEVIDAADPEVLKVFKEQFCAADAKEIREIEEHAKQVDFKPEIVWRNIILFAILHIGAAVGLYQLIFVAMWKTVLWTVTCWILSVIGITAGAHRLWSHKSYKAKWPARLFLLMCNSMAFQNDAIEWSRDHRCHHKWCDTDADPHNTNRGFFFSHMGWLLVRKHPEVKRKGAQLDLSDLFSDPLLTFQRKFYKLLVLFFCFFLPTYIPSHFWGESKWIAFYTAVLFRYCFTLHDTWLINSAAHKWGFKPYNPKITPIENFLLTVAAFGEGGHNYHHTFPQDYRTSEYTMHHNITKIFIDFLCLIGQAYELKVVPQEVIDRQKGKQISKEA